MTPLEQALQGIVIAYVEGPRTAANSRQLLSVIEKVLDYFTQVKENDPS